MKRSTKKRSKQIGIRKWFRLVNENLLSNAETEHILTCLQNEFEDQIKGQRNYESITNIALASIRYGYYGYISIVITFIYLNIRYGYYGIIGYYGKQLLRLQH